MGVTDMHFLSTHGVLFVAQKTNSIASKVEKFLTSAIFGKSQGSKSTEAMGAVTAYAE